jgi:hypothetical protein
MKTLTLFFFSFALLFTESCKKSDNPITPSDTNKKIRVSGYGLSIDSFYFTIWSDSSWEEYNKTISIGGITYTTVINNSGDEYYYSAIGYAGWKPKGESLILFDEPLPILPDTMECNKVYLRNTTFFYQGYNYSIQYEHTLFDTVNVSIPLGIFNCCLYMKTKATVTVSTQSQTQTSYWWAAKGPATIKQTLNSGNTIVLVRGVINGQGWGMSFPKKLPFGRNNGISKLLKDIQIPLLGRLTKSVHIQNMKTL